MTKLEGGPSEQAVVAAGTLVPVSSQLFFVPGGGVTSLTIQFPTLGTYQVTADWTLFSSDVDLYMTNTSCFSESQIGSTCPILGKDNGYLKPATFYTYAAAPGFYKVWIVNYGAVSESGTLRVNVAQ